MFDKRVFFTATLHREMRLNSKKHEPDLYPHVKGVCYLKDNEGSVSFPGNIHAKACIFGERRFQIQDRFQSACCRVPTVDCWLLISACRLRICQISLDTDYECDYVRISFVIIPKRRCLTAYNFLMQCASNRRHRPVLIPFIIEHLTFDSEHFRCS